MEIGVIDWTAFSWEAFATLSSGVSAVVAAAIIGLRQLSLARQQTKILERQTALGAIALRKALFDERMEIYRVADDFIREVIVTRGLFSPQSGEKLKKAVRDSRFLFREEVYNFLGFLDERAYSLREAQVMPSQRQELYGSTAESLIDWERRLLDWFSERSMQLADVFEPELQLRELTIGAAKPLGDLVTY